ncbi:MAG TPA: hypothetical protein VD905_08235 [Flavobacteriales bacterium]|nr:hypothetical protein [Flavobacteriales bacterium]
MRVILFSILFFAQTYSFCQDTTITWYKDLDSINYRLSYSKDQLPKESYAVIGIDSLKEITNPNEKFRTGCVDRDGLPSKQLNWIATDNKGHMVICVTHGGRALITDYFLFDTDKGVLNINQLVFRRKLTFGQTIARIKSGEYEIEAGEFE